MLLNIYLEFVPSQSWNKIPASIINRKLMNSTKTTNSHYLVGSENCWLSWVTGSESSWSFSQKILERRQFLAVPVVRTPTLLWRCGFNPGQELTYQLWMKQQQKKYECSRLWNWSSHSLTEDRGTVSSLTLSSLSSPADEVTVPGHIDLFTEILREKGRRQTHKRLQKRVKWGKKKKEGGGRDEWWRDEERRAQPDNLYNPISEWDFIIFAVFHLSEASPYVQPILKAESIIHTELILGDRVGCSASVQFTSV